MTSSNMASWCTSIELHQVPMGHVRYVSPRREGTTPSRGRVVAGWNFGASLESASSFSFWSLFDILCRKWYWPVPSLSLCHLQVRKRWNLHSKRRGKCVKASLMLVNRTRRRKKFLELAIWEVFYRRKRGLMNVDKQHVLQQLCSVSVDFQQFEGSILLLKKT